MAAQGNTQNLSTDDDDAEDDDDDDSVGSPPPSPESSKRRKITAGAKKGQDTGTTKGKHKSSLSHSSTYSHKPDDHPQMAQASESSPRQQYAQQFNYNSQQRMDAYQLPRDALGNSQMPMPNAYNAQNFAGQQRQLQFPQAVKRENGDYGPYYQSMHQRQMSDAPSNSVKVENKISPDNRTFLPHGRPSSADSVRSSRTSGQSPSAMMPRYVVPGSSANMRPKLKVQIPLGDSSESQISSAGDIRSIGGPLSGGTLSNENNDGQANNDTPENNQENSERTPSVDGGHSGNKLKSESGNGGNGGASVATGGNGSGGNNGPWGSSLLLPPPSPSSYLNSSTTSGPGNPFGRPPLVNSNGEQTPISAALPSKYVNDLLPSPSNFYGSEWDLHFGPASAGFSAIPGSGGPPNTSVLSGASAFPQVTPTSSSAVVGMPMSMGLNQNVGGTATAPQPMQAMGHGHHVHNGVPGPPMGSVAVNATKIGPTSNDITANAGANSGGQGGDPETRKRETTASLMRSKRVRM